MKILLPIDGSVHSQNAIKTAAHAVRLLGEQTIVILVNVVAPLAQEVIDDMANIDVLDTTFADVLLRQHYDEESVKLFNHAKEMFENAPCCLEEVTLVGHPATRIAELADKLEVDLIMMGSHGHSCLETMVFGSVTEGVLTRTTKPVLVARERSFVCTSGADIVMAVDVKGDDASMAKFVATHREFFGEDPQFSFVHVLRELIDTTGLVNPLRDRFEEAGIKAQDVSLTGNPAEMLTQYVQSKKPNLLVMGSRGYRWMDPRVFGSVTLKVIQSTDVPVLIVHPKKQR